MTRIDWSALHDFLEPLRKRLPQGECPLIMGYHHSEDWKTTRDYEQAREDLSGQVDVALEDILLNGKTPRLKKEIWHFVSERLRYASALSTLLATLPKPFAGTVDASVGMPAPQLVYWMVADVWYYHAHGPLKPIRDILCGQRVASMP